ncbi:MAG: electron transfer flavoprotein subunit beta/FixA family protein [Clostridiales Family XIII bacterium]|jgi:electron transfer flavoprotein beta subunit|nr:electron transfer flavoprotein subunit beta/FixA family protein [Clostridiales Family XIII bacterium]
MNIVVLLKQTFDTEAKIVISGGKVDPTGVTLVINPYDEFAIEEALTLKEAQGEGSEITVVTAGGDVAEQALRTALAMGCDKSILVSDEALDGADEWAAAEAVAAALKDVEYDIIFAGRIAVDDASGQVAVRVAEALGIPSVSSILKFETDGTVATVTREIDGGNEIIEVPLPAMLTAQKGLNEPRLPNMMGIMKAKSKPLEKKDLAAVGKAAGDVAAKFVIDSVSLPTPREAGTILKGEAAETAPELVRLLHEEAKVI